MKSIKLLKVFLLSAITLGLGSPALFAAGGNVEFKDGHVQWRPFSHMIVRTGANDPGFWW
jgi:hypothetical protein